jgi:4-hydroxy-tetrahydrodipicolinate synthase
VSIRKLFDGKQLVPGVKALIAHIHGDVAWGRVEPPLSPCSREDRATIAAGYDAVRGRGAQATGFGGKRAQAG